METKKELMNSIFSKLTNREQNIINQLSDNNKFLINIMTELSNYIDLIIKTKGNAKKEILEKKLIRYLKKEVKKIFLTVKPSSETFVFHTLLDCLTRLSYLVKRKSKIIQLTANRLEKSIEEVEVFFSTTNIDKLNVDLSDRIYDKLKPIDTRISNFLDTLIEYNDSVINNDLLQAQIDGSKEYVEITSPNDFKNLYKEYEFLKEIMKSCVMGTTAINDLELKYSDKQKSELKYNFSRIKNFVLEIEKEMKLSDKLYKCGKYKELILRSFIDAQEEITYKRVNSYLEYLIWIDKKGKLKEEYGLLAS